MYRPEQLAWHLTFARENGVTESEITELLPTCRFTPDGQRRFQHSMCLASLILNEETHAHNPHRHFCAAFRAMARSNLIDAAGAWKIIFSVPAGDCFQLLTATARGKADIFNLALSL